MITTRSQTQKHSARSSLLPLGDLHEAKRITKPKPNLNSKSKPKPKSKPQPRSKFPSAYHRAPISPTTFGLIQERPLCHDLYPLLIQAILWNQTTGRAALPVLITLLSRYPDPVALSTAPLPDLTSLLQPIGLHNQRAARLMAFGAAWVASPPCAERRYVRRDYSEKGDGRDARVGEVLGVEDERVGWEVAHLPGMGPYALDSYRIFARDRMRGLQGVKGVEPEWKRVRPGDKDLRAWLRWRWEREGWVWDPVGGKVVGRIM